MKGRKQELFLTFVIGFYLLCNMPWGSLLRTKIIVMEEVKVGESFRYNGISLMCEHAPDATCKGCFLKPVIRWSVRNWCPIVWGGCARIDSMYGIVSRVDA